MSEKMRYTLLDKKIPLIEGNRIVIDSGVGGRKLLYLVKHYNIHNLFGMKIPSIFPSKTEKVIFLRPYKKVWDKKRNRLPKNYWGRIKDPLTNLWVIVEKDYEALPGSIPVVIINRQIKDHDIIRYLNKATEEFSLITKK